MLVILSFFVIRPFLIALFLGTLLTYIFYPLNKFLCRKIKNSTVVSLLICIMVLVVLLVPAVFFTKSLVQESYAIYVLAKQKLATGFFQNCENSFCEALSSFGQSETVNYKVQELARTVTNWVIHQGSSFLLRLPVLLLNLFVILFTMFYFLKDGDIFLEKLNQYLDLHSRRNSFIAKRLKDIINGVVFGYILVALIQGALGALGFFIFGISSPLFWGMVMAFMALIPYFGTGVIWIPAAIILFLDGMFQDSGILIFKGVGLFVFGFVLISGADNLLRPKWMGHKAKIHPLVILLGLLGGLFIFGSVGVILGPLILSLMVLAIEVYFVHRE